MHTEIPWQKSSFSGAAGEQCVELAADADAILIRESDSPALAIRTTPAAARAFLAHLRTS